MTFTDDDLKRYLEINGDVPFYVALIARLDAAENCIMHLYSYPDYKTNPVRRDLLAWKKAAGK